MSTISLLIVKTDDPDDTYSCTLVRKSNGFKEFQIQASQSQPGLFCASKILSKAYSLTLLRDNTDLSVQIDLSQLSLDTETTLTLTNPEGAKVPITVLFASESDERMDPQQTGSFVLSLSGLCFPQAQKFQSSNQSFGNSAKQAREFMLAVKCDTNQVAHLSFDQMEADKFLQKASFWCRTDSTIEFTVEEHQYRLERDEEAMIQRLKQTNTAATGLAEFLNETQSKEDRLKPQSFDNLIEKKRIFDKKVVKIAGPKILVS